VKLEQSFEVQAPIDQVWRALNDLEQVAPCLPGASITGHDEDGTYHGTFQVKLGPATASYRGTIKIEDADESAHRATLKARGTDKRGQGGASATIVNTLSSVDGGTRVDAVTDFSITGRLAAFGRGGMMQDISNRLMRDFAGCLQTRLAGDGAPAAPSPAPSPAPPSAGDEAPPAPSGADEAPPPPSAGDEAPPPPSAGDEPPPPAPPGADEPPPPPPPAADAPPPPPAPSGADGPPAPPPAAPGAAAPPPAAPGSAGPPPPPGPAAPPRPPAPPAVPVKGGSLFLSILWERIKRLFGGGRSG
jgi:uncharacterized protein